jgi:hypothetical protein
MGSTGHKAEGDTHSRTLQYRLYMHCFTENDEPSPSTVGLYLSKFESMRYNNNKVSFNAQNFK